MPNFELHTAPTDGTRRAPVLDLGTDPRREELVRARSDRWKLALPCASFALVMASCGTYVRRFQQDELKLIGGRIERTPTGVHFAPLRACTSGILITRVSATFGLDANEDGQLTSPADLIVRDFDQTQTTDEIAIGSTRLVTDRVRDAIAHIEIYQTILPTPIYSETWHAGDAPPFL